VVQCIDSYVGEAFFKPFVGARISEITAKKLGNFDIVQLSINDDRSIVILAKPQSLIGINKWVEGLGIVGSLDFSEKGLLSDSFEIKKITPTWNTEDWVTIYSANGKEELIVKTEVNAIIGIISITPTKETEYLRIRGEQGIPAGFLLV